MRHCTYDKRGSAAVVPVIKDLNGSVKSIGFDVAKGNESRARLCAKDEISGEYSDIHTEGVGLGRAGGLSLIPNPCLKAGSGWMPQEITNSAPTLYPPNFAPQTLPPQTLPEGVLWMI